MEFNRYVAVIVLGTIAVFVIEWLVRRVTHLDRRFAFVPPYEQSDPVTDEEFVALCRPGVKPETALKVRAIVAEQLAIPPERIRPEHRFVEDLLAD